MLTIDSVINSNKLIYKFHLKSFGDLIESHSIKFKDFWSLDHEIAKSTVCPVINSID